jgi:hypothetical protein
MSIIANGLAVLTNNVLSIISISIEGRADFMCTAYGIDGSLTQLVANQVSNEPSVFAFCALPRPCNAWPPIHLFK